MEINTGIVAEHMGMSVGWTPELFHVHQLKAEPMRVMMRFSPASRTAGLHNLDLLRSQLVANGNADSDILLRVPEFRINDQEESHPSLTRSVCKHYTERLLSQFYSAMMFDPRAASFFGGGGGGSALSLFACGGGGRGGMGAGMLPRGLLPLAGMPERSRPPRMFGLDDSLQMFIDHGEAFDGPMLLGSVKGRWQREEEAYVVHFESKETVCMVTNKSLLCARRNTLQLEWEVNLDDIDEVQIHFGHALQVLDRDTARAYAVGHRTFDVSLLSGMQQGYSNSTANEAFKHIFVCENLDVLEALKSMLDWHVLARTTLS